MHRIVTIPGRSAAARRARLMRVQAWMARRDWRLADFSEDEGSALFERDADAPRLGLLDGTRWLPAPRALFPLNWPATVRADPRLALLPALVLGLAIVLGLALFGPSSFDVERLRQDAAAENWRSVQADQLNVRAGPGTHHPVVGVLHRNQRVLVEGEVDETWVKLGPPVRGYVSREYLAPADAPAESEAGADAVR